MPFSGDISDQYIDIITIHQYKLCVYPSCLVFGKPVFQHCILTYLSDQYLLIKERHLSLWFQFFDKLAQILGETEEHSSSNKETIIVIDSDCNSDNFDTVDITTLQNYCSFILKINKNDKTIELCAHYRQKICFNLDETDCFKLMDAFQTLFFKIYCYEPIIQYYVMELVKKCEKKDLEDKSGQKIFDFIQTVYSLPENQFHYVTELIQRHRLLFLHFKTLQILQ